MKIFFPTIRLKIYFIIFKLENNVFNIFSLPFNIGGETVLDELQMELIGWQNGTDLTNQFQNVDIDHFYQNYMNLEKFRQLGGHAKKIMSFFCVCVICVLGFLRCYYSGL